MFRRSVSSFQRHSGPSIPQIIGRLIDSFPTREGPTGPVPVGKYPIGKWAASLPEEVNETLANHGGLAKFSTDNGNFFTVSRENGTLVVSLTNMAVGLVKQKRFKDAMKTEQKQYEKKRF